MIKKLFSGLLPSKNDRELKKYKKRVDEINALEKDYEGMSDDELKNSFEKLKQRVVDGESLDSVLIQSFAITREASKRVLGLRHFDVQLVGGMVLHEGRIAEMKTGEGKTLVATLPVVLNAMTGKTVCVVTVNDYLASRDGKEMGKLYEFLGYKVGVIVSEGADTDKVDAYSSNIIYGTNNEYGFDYLRDNLKYSFDEKLQKDHYFAIVDEVDSILIDEARTPLIISGPVNRRIDNYAKADKIAKQLEIEKHFNVDEKNKTVLMTEEGVNEAEKLFEVDNLYSLENAILAHHLDQALRANHLFTIDVDYVNKDGEIVIVDEFTGRLSEGRRYSEGLHQALEAKEGVKIKEESQTFADITYQNYFRMFDKLAGMTGTAQTEAAEFSQIYSLDVVSIPTNVPITREDKNDLIYKSEKEKFDAVIEKIVELNKKGQPVLVGTGSIERSEYLSSLLKKQKIKHTVLNAKQHDKEAEIIMDAGKKGAITIATNMAGRGVDIKLSEEIKELGGLYIIGTERHESRRIDNQLRGRSGRQGDPGVSQFYLSLEDSLLRIFGSDKIRGIMDRLGVEEGEHIESRMVTRAVENAQKKVESMHFESRKHLLEYDDVANEQRKVVFRLRDELLNKEYDLSTKIVENRNEAVTMLLESAEVYEGIAKEDMNYERVVGLLKEEFNYDIDISKINDLEYEQLSELLVSSLEEAYEEKMSMATPERRSEIERIVYLQVLDNAWRDHLYQMDVLKTGIGLRGYNQKDPLTEYKKESFNLFVEMIGGVKFEAIKTLQILQLKSESEEQDREEAQRMLKRMEEELQGSVSFSDAKTEPQRVEKKPARNEPCPCGSGKKYKHCCGQSGPKKGALAN
ncbi:MAG: preprotein translocase subunit SecA [Campylobacterales bacterium]